MEETALELGQLLCEEKLEGVPLLILANKQDLISAMSAEEISEGFDLTSIRDRTWNYTTLLCQNWRRATDGMEWLVGMVNTTAKATVNTVENNTHRP